jgi:hypothetical protein
MKRFSAPFVFTIPTHVSAYVEKLHIIYGFEIPEFL